MDEHKGHGVRETGKVRTLVVAVSAADIQRKEGTMKKRWARWAVEAVILALAFGAGVLLLSQGAQEPEAKAEGPVDIQGMAVNMSEMSGAMNGLLAYVKDMMQDENLMRDEKVRKEIDLMRRHMDLMSREMNGAVANMEAVARRMAESGQRPLD